MPDLSEVLKTLAVVASKFPELRLGQLIDNAVTSNSKTDVYYIEDTELQRCLIEYAMGYRRL